jgi:hypothetical protein
MLVSSPIGTKGPMSRPSTVPVNRFDSSIRRDVWDERFKLNGPVIQPLTLEGEVTATVLPLNAAFLEAYETGTNRTSGDSPLPFWLASLSTSN